MCTLFNVYYPAPPPPALRLEKLGLCSTIGAVIWSKYLHAVSAPPPRHGVSGLLRNSAGGGGAWAVGIHIVPWTNHPESFILTYNILTYNRYSSTYISLTYNSVSKGQSLHSHNINALSPFRRVGEIFCRPCLPPIFRAGWVRGCGRLGPPLSFVLANARVGAGGKGQALQMTILHLSYVSSSLSPGPFIPNLIPYSTLTVIASQIVCNLSPRVWILM